ncbi:hypothetical protein MMAD_37990 [Mycolicibacterium madagascariense]|uniref:Uncharacterized protein n=1 Tax=Mycolicibacterium madagascariense TaxID=212765 RepID=A0A7I7XJX3_9MYCO|nr:hypothetical protein [Mycolicibacterium madagascariense]MCV7010829.1 hypothetical protein [Mycolicibacterium madagascariense]BBZ29504.1 hypothetical protein MMAD_37990 [Mycolicibacterium madagascariense]
MSTGERGLWLDDAAHREDLATFVERAMRLDDTGVIRLRARGERQVVAWLATGFDVLASRVVGGRITPADMSVGADALAAALPAMDRTGYVDPGFAMDSAWRGMLPPETGFTHLDDVPARVVLDLAQRGVALAKEYGSAHGPPASLLDQEVVAVSAGDVSVGIPMRCVFALTAMGFLPQAKTVDQFAPESVTPDEVVRVRVLPTWLRVDARFGTVYRRRGDPAVVLR